MSIKAVTKDAVRTCHINANMRAVIICLSIRVYPPTFGSRASRATGILEVGRVLINIKKLS